METFPIDPLETEDLLDSADLEELPVRGGAVKGTTQGVDLIGSTAYTPISEVLREIVQRELSGDLQIISSRAKRTLYFDRGFIVFAGSNLKKDRLGQRLIDSGRLTKSEVEKARRLQKGRLRFGEALIREAMLDEEELGREVVRQAKDIVLTAYELEGAVYSFDERPCIIPMELRLGLSVYRIQLEGIRRISRGDLIRRALGSLERPVRTVEIPPFSFKESELHPLERKLVDLATAAKPLQPILHSADGDEEEAVRAAYGLLCAGILEYTDSGPQTRQVQEETESLLLSSLERTRVSAPTNVRQEVLLQFDALEQASPAELLDVDESADEEEIGRAYRKQQEEWRKKQALLTYEKSLFVKVEEIQRCLAEAQARILKERREGSSDDGVPDADEMEIPLEDEDEIPVEIEDEEGQSSELASGVSTSVDALHEEAGPQPAEEAPEGPVVRNPVLAERSKRGGSHSVSVEAISDQLKRLLYDVKVRKAVNDREGAISLLYEVVGLVPTSAKHEAMLAEALAAHPVLSKRAERHFRRALSLEPQNADLHYRLGRYYQAHNMRSRALAEFKIALRIDPNHSKARSSLAEGKDASAGPVEQLFKRIFG